MTDDTRNSVGVDISKAHLDAYMVPAGKARQAGVSAGRRKGRNAFSQYPIRCLRSCPWGEDASVGGGRTARLPWRSGHDLGERPRSSGGAGGGRGVGPRPDRQGADVRRSKEPARVPASSPWKKAVR